MIIFGEVCFIIMILCTGLLIGEKAGRFFESGKWEDKVVAKGYGRFEIQEKPKRKVVFAWNEI